MELTTVMYIEVYQLQDYGSSRNIAVMVRGRKGNRSANFVETLTISGALALLRELSKKSHLIIDFPVAYRKQIRTANKIYKLQTLDDKTVEELSL